MAWWLTIGIGGKTFDVIQSMYKNSKCAGNLRSAFFQQGRVEWGRDAVWTQPCLTSTSTSWQNLWTAPAASARLCCMRMTWFCCSPQLRVSSTAWPCWNSTVKNEHWRSTWTEPESWCSRGNTYRVLEHSTSYTWASRSLHQGALV